MAKKLKATAVCAVVAVVVVVFVLKRTASPGPVSGASREVALRTSSNTWPLAASQAGRVPLRATGSTAKAEPLVAFECSGQQGRDEMGLSARRRHLTSDGTLLRLVRPLTESVLGSV